MAEAVINSQLMNNDEGLRPCHGIIIDHFTDVSALETDQYDCHLSQCALSFTPTMSSYSDEAIIARIKRKVEGYRGIRAFHLVISIHSRERISLMVDPDNKTVNMSMLHGVVCGISKVYHIISLMHMKRKR